MDMIFEACVMALVILCTTDEVNEEKEKSQRLVNSVQMLLHLMKNELTNLLQGEHRHLSSDVLATYLSNFLTKMKHEVDNCAFFVSTWQGIIVTLTRDANDPRALAHHNALLEAMAMKLSLLSTVLQSKIRGFLEEVEDDVWRPVVNQVDKVLVVVGNQQEAVEAARNLQKTAEAPVVLSHSDIQMAACHGQCAIRVYCTTNQPKEEFIGEADAFFSAMITGPRAPSHTEIACSIERFVTTITENVREFKTTLTNARTKINTLLNGSAQDTEVDTRLVTIYATIDGMAGKVKVLQRCVFGERLPACLSTFQHNEDLRLALVPVTRARDEAISEIQCLQDSFVSVFIQCCEALSAMSLRCYFKNSWVKYEFLMCEFKKALDCHSNGDFDGAVAKCGAILASVLSYTHSWMPPPKETCQLFNVLCTKTQTLLDISKHKNTSNPHPLHDFWNAFVLSHIQKDSCPTCPAYFISSHKAEPTGSKTVGLVPTLQAPPSSVPDVAKGPAAPPAPTPPLTEKDSGGTENHGPMRRKCSGREPGYYRQYR